MPSSLNHRLSLLVRYLQRAVLLRSIGGRFALYTLGFSLLLALASTAVQTHLVLEAERERLTLTLEGIEKSYGSPLSRNLWNVDALVLRLQLEGMLHIPDVRFAQVLDSDGSVVVAVGTRPTEALIERQFDLVHQDGQRTELIGHAVVAATLQGPAERALGRLGWLLAGELLSFVLIWLFMLLMFHLLIGRHLNRIATATAGSGDPLKAAPLQLERGFRMARAPDELDCLVAVLNDSSLRLRQMFGELLESKRRYSDIIENIELIAVTLDRAGCITYCNDHLLRLTGWTREEVMGRDWFACFLPAQHAPVKDVFAAVVADDAMGRHFQNNIVTRSGQQLTVRFSNSVLRDASGQVIGTASIGEDITLRLANEERIRANEALLSAIVNTVTDGLITIDEKGVVQTFNAAASRIFDYGADEVVGRNVNMLMPESYSAGHDGYLCNFLGSRQPKVIGLGREVMGRRKDGSTFPMELAVSEMVANGQRGFTGSVRDISERRQAEEQMRLASMIFQSSPEAMLVADLSDRILTANPAFSRITGHAAETITGQTLRLLRSDLHDANFYRALRQRVADAGQWQGEMWLRCRDGADITCSVTMRTILDADGRAYSRVVLFTDISAHKAAQELVWRQANFDALTGLVNRSMFLDRLERDVRQSDGKHQRLGLLVIDLDRFKEINDTLSHAAGDVMLVHVAQRLKELVREGDTLARIGGDEFALILARVDDAVQIESIATELLRRFEAPFELAGEATHVSVSVGIAVYPDDGLTAETLLKQADQAVFAAKAQGRNCYQFFTARMQEAVLARIRIARDLRVALAQQQLRVVYQPIVDLQTGHINKAEALVRWQHPEWGFVSPATFIPVAEETGLIGQIGDWVFETTVAQVARWRTSLDPTFCISVNTSPIQFKQEPTELARRWIAHLQQLGLPGDSLVIEITEGVLMDESSTNFDSLTAFRSVGIGVALDDFGTGYSSLAYLKRYPVDFVKIDQAFVRHLQAGSRDQALCEAIIAMAHKLGMRVVAEGVETVEHADLLRSAGCDFGQGYLFAKPMSAEDLEALVRQQASAALVQG